MSRINLKSLETSNFSGYPHQAEFFIFIDRLCQFQYTLNLYKLAVNIFFANIRCRMNFLETEVKFYLPNVDSVRDSIIELGAVSKGRFFETNIRFEDKSNSLIKRKSLLRLRKDTKSTLTYKSQPNIQDKNFKIQKEIEVEVSSFTNMALILQGLSFHEEQVYEKWRETLTLKSTIFCVDTLPFGNFLEIEGNKKNINYLANKLNLSPEKRIIINYLEIFQIIKKKTGIVFHDVTFDNFKNIQPDITPYLHLMQIGSV